MDNGQILDDYRYEEPQLIPASREKRFLNYLIDLIVVYVLVFIAFGFVYDVDELAEDRLSTNLVGIAIFVIYYFVLESMNGKTFGKMLTRTRTVDYNGQQPSTNQMIQRSLSRIVPFEPMSFFGSGPDGWHDRWSHTMVVDEGLSEL